MPSTDASKVASSTSVDIADVMAFHSSGVFVLASKIKLIQCFGYHWTILNLTIKIS
jgi:hypothetical protein